MLRAPGLPAWPCRGQQYTEDQTCVAVFKDVVKDSSRAFQLMHISDVLRTAEETQAVLA